MALTLEFPCAKFRYSCRAVVPDLVRRIGMGAYSGIDPVIRAGPGHLAAWEEGRSQPGFMSKPNSLFRAAGTSSVLPVHVKPARSSMMGMGIKEHGFLPLT